MSAVVVGSSYAAAAKAAQDREEEEHMTGYSEKDLDNNWEFKILRATNFNGFKDYNTLREVLEEEAQNGWTLVEKFDNYRLRLKRKRVSVNDNSQNSVDPYRTYYGPSGAVLAFIILGIIFGAVFLFMVIGLILSTQ